MGIINLIRSIRQLYWKHRFKSCGKDFLCNSGVTIRSAKNIEVGSSVRIGEKSFINAVGGLKIGNNVKIGQKVVICTSNHNYDKPTRLPYAGDNHKQITIGDHVWIEACAGLVPGVTIGEGAIVGMCAVVTKDVPPCAVVGGNPAKILKYRDKEAYEKLKKEYHYSS